MKVAAIQMNSGPSVDENLEVVSDLVADAAAAGAKLVVLPENACLMADTHQRRLAVAARGDEVAARLADMARGNSLCLVGGTIPLPAPDSRVTNSCLVYSAAGELMGRYDKMHLFDVQLDHGETYGESEHTVPGDVPLSVEALDTCLGITICYDMRFPELYRDLASRGAEVFTVPSAFTVATGEAHWEVLLRARAIENLAMVIAPAQEGTHVGGRKTYGHSMIISPWGEILAQQRFGSGVIVAELDLLRLRQQRDQFPVLRHRRFLGSLD